MENLFSRLSSPVNDKTKLEIIRRNLLPSYQYQLTLMLIDSPQELIQYCRRVEDTTNSSSLLEPHLGYKKTRVHAAAVSLIRTKLVFI